MGFDGKTDYVLVYTTDQIVGYYEDDGKTTLDDFLRTLDSENQYVPDAKECQTTIVKYPTNYRVEKGQLISKVPEFEKAVTFSTDEAKLLMLCLFYDRLDEEHQKNVKMYLNKIVKEFGGIEQIYIDLIEGGGSEPPS